MDIPKFLTLSYMHRDEGNYKTFGTAILENDLQLPLDLLDQKLKEQLIDDAYFYPSKWMVPNLDPSEGSVDGFEEWNEYLGLEELDESQVPTATTISHLLFTSQSPKKQGAQPGRPRPNRNCEIN